jgi:hypothetical protein
MGYPVEGGEIVDQGDLLELQEIFGGRNQLVDVFKEEGYEFVMVESSWSGGRCTEAVDVCVASRWPDEATSFAIDRSAFGIGGGPFKDSPSAGTLRTLKWLEDDLAAYLANGRPDFVFAHLLIPHAPLHVGSGCGYEWNVELSGLTVGVPDDDLDRLNLRKAAYIAQVECAQSAMVKVAALVDDDTVFLVFGDHGPDSQAQLFRDPSGWTRSDVEERMHVFFAAKAGNCSFEGVRSLVNVGPRLLGCLTGSEIPQVEDRFFLATGSTDQAGEPYPVHEIWMTGG